MGIKHPYHNLVICQRKYSRNYQKITEYAPDRNRCYRT